MIDSVVFDLAVVSVNVVVWNHEEVALWTIGIVITPTLPKDLVIVQVSIMQVVLEDRIFKADLVVRYLRTLLLPHLVLVLRDDCKDLFAVREN